MKRIKATNLSDNEKRTIATSLIYWRRLNGLSQEGVAKKLQTMGYDISRETISSYENGRHLYDIGGLLLFAEVYNTSLPELIKIAEIEDNRKKIRKSKGIKASQ